jgi:hypothetical protein
MVPDIIDKVTGKKEKTPIADAIQEEVDHIEA